MATQQEIQLQQALNDLIKDQRNLISEINSELKEGLNINKEVRKQYGILENISDKLVSDAEEALELSQKQLDKEKDKAKNVVKQLENAYKILKVQIEQGKKLEDLTVQERALLEAGEQQFAIEKATVELIDRRINYQKNLNKSIGLTGTLLKSAAKITEKLGLSGLDDVFKEAKNAAVEKSKALGVSDQKALGLSGKIKTMGAGLSVLAKGIGKSLVDPLVLLGAQIAIIKKFYDLYGDVNKQIVNQGKQLNISKEQSQGLYENAFKYASEQRNAFVTAERILEGRYKLNEALGTSIAFTDKEAITAEKLSHYYGISEEQNAHLAVLAREIGQTNNDILNNVIRTTNEQKRQFGGTLSQQKILQKVSSVSGEILTKFKGNVNELTKAVMQADRLGLTLEQVDKIGESLLNFEQSIESELKAELLTGKAINVEKARAAALSGDTAKLTEEIAKQVGSIHEFEKMNVIQRKAYAEVFGMSVGEMGDMLRKREFENKLQLTGKETAAEQLRLATERGITIDESIRKDLEAKSLAESQKYTFEKIESILKRISAGPMATIYKYLEKGLKFVESIFGFFSKMTGGTLGTALGAAIMGAPLLIGITKLAMGAAKSIFFNGMSPATAPWMRLANPMGGIGGTGGAMGNTITSSRGLVLTKAGGPAAVATPGVGGFMKSPMGLGLAGMGVGLLTSAVTSNMEAGGAKTTVGTVGGAASGAMMGAAFGPYGMLIGGLIGGIGSLVSGLSEDREKRKQEAEAAKEAQRKTNEALEALAIRPLEMKVNNDTIAKWNTYSQQNGSNGYLSN